MAKLIFSQKNCYVADEGLVVSMHDAKPFADGDNTIDDWLNRARTEFPDYGFYVVTVPDELVDM